MDKEKSKKEEFGWIRKCERNWEKRKSKKKSWIPSKKNEKKDKYGGKQWINENKEIMAEGWWQEKSNDEEESQTYINRMNA